MKWHMEIYEVEAVLEKIWDLHDKLSDAIHSVSRTHFLNSLKKSPPSSDGEGGRKKPPPFIDFSDNNNGFVYVKDFDRDFSSSSSSSAISEAKSLNAIRSALENLEDQLEFLHTVQLQQRAERDAAIAQLEQSRMILALRLAEHHGKRYKVIEEAMDFVGDVRDSSCFISPENLSCPHASAPAEHFMDQGGRKSNLFVRILSSGFDCARRSLELKNVGGVVGNAAIFAISMLAFLHLQRVDCKNIYVVEVPNKEEGRTSLSGVGRIEGSLSSSSNCDFGGGLDVLAARG